MPLMLISGLTVITVLMLYHRLSLYLWASSILVVVWAYWWVLTPTAFYLAFNVLITIGLLAIVLPQIRRILFSKTLFKAFKKILPPMSDTERQALEAGDTWWDAELFTGKPNWKRLLDTPEPRLTDEEQAFLDGPTHKLCEMIDDWVITHHERRIPDSVWEYMKQGHFFGMIIPKKYGGLEFSALAHSSVVLKVSSRSLSAAVTIMVPNSLGPAELIMEYGTEEQKEYYLPRLACGKDIPCFALTSAEAGSDAGAMPDLGTVCYGSHDGKDNVLGIRLNWKKRYITLVPVATLIGLAFHLEDPDNLLGKGTEPGITCALIPRNTPGVEVGRRHYPLNQAFQNGPTEGHDVFIPVDWIIGGAERAGQGWQMLMESLSVGRSISLPSLSVGGAMMASRATGAYARIREQFGLPIGKFEGVEERLARIAANTYMMDAARILTLGAVDRGHHPSVLSAIVKQQLTEKMRVVVNDAMDIQGGSGISLGPRNIFGRVYQALPISITVEGANILTRSLIIFGQGAVRCHPYVFKEMEAAAMEDRSAALKQFDVALFGHIGMSLSNSLRAFWLGLTNGRTAKVPIKGAGRRYLQQLDRMSAAFALVSDFCMLTLGGSLKKKEHISGRLADVFSLLYLTSATIKRFEADGALEEDFPLLRAACHDAFYTMQERLNGVMRNLPIPLVGGFLRLLVFPRGRAYSAPYDAFLKGAAAILLSPSAARDRLTKGIYISDDTNDQTGRLEDALIKVVNAEDDEKKLKQAVRDGIIPACRNTDELIAAAEQSGHFTKEEMERIKLARAARMDVIQVDDFPADLGLTDSQLDHTTRDKVA